MLRLQATEEEEVVESFTRSSSCESQEEDFFGRQRLDSIPLTTHQQHSISLLKKSTTIKTSNNKKSSKSSSPLGPEPILKLLLAEMRY